VVTLRNRSKTEPRTLILDTDDPVASHALRTIATVQVEVHNPKTGDRSLKGVRRRLPKSITLQPKGVEGDKVEGLPNHVLKCREVIKARDAKQIDVIVTDEPAKAAQVEPPPAATPAPQLPSQPAEPTQPETDK
jgi:hypothetical protein